MSQREERLNKGIGFRDKRGWIKGHVSGQEGWLEDRLQRVREKDRGQKDGGWIER